MTVQTACNILKIVAFTFSVLIVFNLVMAIPAVVTKTSLERESAKIKAEQLETVQNSGEYHPNFYYLLFDEYASLHQIKEDYGYDNSAFAKSLEELGFNVSYSSSNEYFETDVVMTNIVNLEYIVSQKNAFSLKEFHRYNNALFPLLRNKGYEIVGLENASFYGLPGIKKSSSKTISGDAVIDLLVKNTIIWPFFQSAYDSDTALMLEHMEQLKNVDFPKSNTFILSHFIQPHVPFKYDENGNELVGSVRTDYLDKNVYLGNYIYTTKLMLDMVEQMVQNDPNAIIILTSDHSSRGEHAIGISRKSMCTIFNAVYYANEEVDIEGLSGVNTLRVILNKLLETEYEMLEDPEYVK